MFRLIQSQVDTLIKDSLHESTIVELTDELDDDALKTKYNTERNLPMTAKEIFSLHSPIHLNQRYDFPSGNWPDSNEEVAMLLSGGVDSSVALKLLLLRGFKVRVYLVMYSVLVPDIFICAPYIFYTFCFYLLHGLIACLSTYCGRFELFILKYG